jgi:hypothetical protein
VRSCAIARVVELAADERQERRLDSALRSSAPPPQKRTIALGHLSRDEASAGLDHRGERLVSGHPREPHRFCVIEGIDALTALEVGEVVLAQRDEDAVVGAVEVERSTIGILVSHHRLERLGGRFSTRSARSAMNSPARCARSRPSAPSVKISSNWSKITEA